MRLTDLSNEELLAGVHTLVGQGRIVLARLLEYLGEVEERRLDLQAACSSLFDFCVRRLAMSEDEAYRRVTAARLVRRFPMLLGMIQRGEIHLTGLLMMREYLSAENGEELLHAAAGKSKSELQHVLAERFPRPDAPSSVRSLTDSMTPSEASGQQALIAGPAEATGQPSAGLRSNVHGRRSRIEPLAPARYRVEFTASAGLKEKLAHAADLLRHVNPSGDRSLVVERALDLLLAKLEKQRLAKVTRERGLPPRPNTRPGYVPRAVRREVFERDGERCAFVDESGRRCAARGWLELDHRTARARGGADSASNLSVRCRAHNRWAAEQQFGRKHMDQWTRGNETATTPRRRGRGRDDLARTDGSRPRGCDACTGTNHARRRDAEGLDSTNHPRRRDAEGLDGANDPRWRNAEGLDSTNDPRRRDADTLIRANQPHRRGFEESAGTDHLVERGCDEVAFRALCGMGFRAHEAHRALGIVAQQRMGSPPAPIEMLLREALAALAR